MTYRADHVTQVDGSSLQWANCRMAVGATALDYHTHGDKTSTGAKMRSHQSDQSGGTDAYDLKRAWDAGYDETLIIRDGHYWSDLVNDREKGRFISLDVWYAELPNRCQDNGAIGHTIGIAPETDSNGKWLVSDPLCSGYKWMSPSDLRNGAEEWGRRCGIGSAIKYTTSDYEWSNGVAINFDPKRVQIPKGVDFYESPGGARITEAPIAQTYSSLGYVRGNADWMSVCFSTGSPPVRTVGYFEDKGYTKEPTPGEAWDTVVWSVIHDPNAQYPCPPSGDCPECPECPDASEVIAARDAQWIDHLTPPIPAADNDDLMRTGHA